MHIVATAWCAAALAVTAGSINAQALRPAPDSAAAQRNWKRPQLLGVFDDRGPVDSAEVVDLVTESVVRTTRTGTVALGWQARVKDSSAIQVRKIGYSDTTFILGPRDTVDITVILRRTATALPTVTTTARYELMRDRGLRNDIGDRCAAAHVSCVRQDDLLNHPAANILDFLLKSDGVLLTCPSAGACTASMHGIGGGKCAPTYFLDGMEWNPMSGSALTQLQDFLKPGSIAAMEVYRAEQPMPMRFMGDPRKLCGSVVVWTKR